MTLAAQLELPNGHRALTDAGAVRDLASSLAEGVARHRAEVARRLSTTVVVQYDEPLLFAALAGRLTGVTAMSPVHPVDEVVAIGLLDECVAAADTEVMLHSCADMPWNVLQRSAIHAVSVDVSTLGDADFDGLGEFLDSGRCVVFGLVPTSALREATVGRGSCCRGSGDHRPNRVLPQFGSRPRRHQPGVRPCRGRRRVGPGRDRAVPAGGGRRHRRSRRDLAG